MQLQLSTGPAGGGGSGLTHTELSKVQEQQSHPARKGPYTGGLFMNECLLRCTGWGGE